MRHDGSGHDVNSKSLWFHEKAAFVKRCILKSDKLQIGISSLKVRVASRYF